MIHRQILSENCNELLNPSQGRGWAYTHQLASSSSSSSMNHNHYSIIVSKSGEWRIREASLSVHEYHVGHADTWTLFYLTRGPCLIYMPPADEFIQSIKCSCSSLSRLNIDWLSHVYCRSRIEPKLDIIRKLHKYICRVQKFRELISAEHENSRK